LPVDHIVRNPLAGDLIPGTGGCASSAGRAILKRPLIALRFAVVLGKQRELRLVPRRFGETKMAEGVRPA
jgi:hypothetical protein